MIKKGVNKKEDTYDQKECAWLKGVCAFENDESNWQEWVWWKRVSKIEKCVATFKKKLTNEKWEQLKRAPTIENCAYFQSYQFLW